MAGLSSNSPGGSRSSQPLSVGFLESNRLIEWEDHRDESEETSTRVGKGELKRKGTNSVDESSNHLHRNRVESDLPIDLRCSKRRLPGLAIEELDSSPVLKSKNKRVKRSAREGSEEEKR